MKNRETSKKIKRAFDIAASLSVLVIFSPVWIMTGLLIFLTSKGPVIFRQNRLGYRGKEYEIYKFRTMVDGAEKKGLGLGVTEDDERITKIGKFLRKTSIDEIPQLVNVLKGDMSIVGPRPPAAYYPYEGYKNYPEWAKKRFTFKPGITGYAQVKGRNNISWEKKIKLDLQYINHWSLLLDLKIIFLTAVQVLQKKDIYEDDSRHVEAVFDRRKE